jgi:uncharacterized membrane protein SpoIIM required for sporulation
VRVPARQVFLAAPPEAFVDLDAYVAENAGNWRKLDRLSRRRRLSVDEVDELMALYQRTGAQLSVIRSKAPDALLIAWLSRVVLAARGRITSNSGSWVAAVGRFFAESFPLVVYQSRRWWLTVMAVFVTASGGLIAYIANNPQIRAQLLPDDATKQLVSRSFKDYYSQYPAHHFALQVWTNNALVAGQCLAAGALILPVFYVLGQNILNVGIDGGAMVAYGRSGEFFGLILPHGLLELTAVFIAAGAGMRIGWAFIAPGPGLSRSRSAAEAARSAMLVALGLVVVLLVSGVIEAFVTPSPLPTAARIAIGFIAWAGFLGYVWVFGRRAQERAASADLDEEMSGAVLPSV